MSPMSSSHPYFKAVGLFQILLSLQLSRLADHGGLTEYINCLEKFSIKHNPSRYAKPF